MQNFWETRAGFTDRGATTFGKKKKGAKTFFERKNWGRGLFLKKKKGGEEFFNCKILTNQNLNFLKKPFLAQKVIILEKGDSQLVAGIQYTQ